MHTLVIKIVNGTAVWQYNVVASDCNNHGGKFRNFKGGFLFLKAETKRVDWHHDSRYKSCIIKKYAHVQ